MLVTQISPAVAALPWMSIEWTKYRKPSTLGFATGVFALLVGAWSVLASYVLLELSIA